MNKRNKKKIAIPPTLPIAFLWNACGFKKSLSRRDPEKIFFADLKIKKVKTKLIKEKKMKKFRLNSDNIIYYIIINI